MARYGDPEPDRYELMVQRIRAELAWLNTRGGLDSTHALDTLAAIGTIVGLPVVSEDEDEGEYEDDGE